MVIDIYDKATGKKVAECPDSEAWECGIGQFVRAMEAQGRTIVVRYEGGEGKDEARS